MTPGRLAPADRDQPRRRVPVGQVLHPGLMRKSGGGSIVMTSSIAGLRGSATLAGYCATKGGVRLFAKAIAMECAARRRQHPGQLGASRHHRHADLGQDPAGPPAAAAAMRRSTRGNGAAAARRSAGSASRRTSPTASCSSLRRVELHDRRRTGDRRRHHRRFSPTEIMTGTARCPMGRRWSARLGRSCGS